MAVVLGLGNTVPKLQPIGYSSCKWTQSSRCRRQRPFRYTVRGAGRDAALESAKVPLDSQWLVRQSLWMAAASAMLGPLCDGQHSSHNVLHYENPLYVQLAGFHLETCWWVPALFAVAGIILGVAHPYLDSLPWGTQPRGGTNPSWTWVLVGIACFVAQYAASGMLEEPLLGHTLGPLPALDVLLCATGMAHWWFFDGTRQGLGMAVLTGVSGPLIEMGLINWLHLYHYTHPLMLGTPTWITWVYLCGSAAVGNLGRKVSSSAGLEK